MTKINDQHYWIPVFVAVLALLAAPVDAARSEVADSTSTTAADAAKTNTTAPPDSPEPSASTQQTADTDALKVTASVDALETYEDTPVGFTAAGYPFRGDPDAPVTLVEYSDYLCPFCARYFNQTLPTLLDQYVRAGKVRLVFRDFPIAALHPTAPRGAQAALCVAEQGPVLFWKMHDELFRRQQEWNRAPDPGEFLGGLAEEIGAERTAYETCMNSEPMAERVERSVAEARELGFNGTPSFQYVRTESGDAYELVGAQPATVFAEWTDALLAGNPPPQPKKPELPVWAKPEGLAPDAERPGFTVAGDPYKGNPEAELVVVEFTDFQCPSCRRHALETQPAVDQEFVETGKLLWVTKHFPLGIHPHAAVAAVAAECAADQAKFWEMQHLLYETQDQWVNGDPDAELVALAEGLALDMPAFNACFNSRQAMERVLDDIYDAQGATRTTPTFVFIHGGKGSAIRGARDAESFLSIVGKMHEAAMAEKDATETASK